MTSTRPYLIRAFYDWIVDNDCTPHIVVNATLPDVMVPEEYVEGGQIVLNIAVSAVSGLLLGDHAIEFSARFGGKVRKVYAPVTAILAIYAKENGRGMVFAEDEETTPPPSSTTTDSAGETKDETGSTGGKDKNGGKKPHLTIVK
jgi:stringent starvation protein B